MCRILTFLLTVVFLTVSAAAFDQDDELKQFQGKWEVVELVEDGKVIPKEAIREWLPSGGKLEISENAIVFTSPDDEKKHVKLFSLDSTQSPKGIEIVSKDRKDGTGIYRFDNGRLIICLADADQPKRPTEFSAREGSKHMLMTLERATPPETQEPTAPQEPSGKTAEILTDAQVEEMLKGTWKYADSVGSLIVTFNADGTFSTVREVKEIRLFQKVFVQTPISTGKWNVQHGRLTFLIQRSVLRERVNREFDFVVRSISDRDFIFVDYLGRVGQAARVR